MRCSEPASGVSSQSDASINARNMGSERIHCEAYSKAGATPNRSDSDAAVQTPVRRRNQRKQKPVAKPVQKTDRALKAPHVLAPAKIMIASTAGYAGGNWACGGEPGCHVST